MVSSAGRRSAGRRVVLVGCVASLVAACSSDGGDGAATIDGAETTVGADTTTAAVAPGERAGIVDIGDGREVYLQCRGVGEPTVVLVSGFADNADVWNTPADPEGDPRTVDADVAAFSRVCAYDRPGTTSSRSTPVPQPTSAQDAADDLERLLAASGEVGPYVLVGHSYGGPIIRLFASDHPTEVAGMVLVDALSEDLPNLLTTAQRALFEEMNSPPPVADAEALDLQGTVDALEGSPPPPAVPVVVLTADQPQLTPELLASGNLPAGVDQAFADALWSAQLIAQDLLAARFDGAEHVKVTNSNHYIQLYNPQLVIDSIRQVVDTARGTEAED